MTRRPRRRGKRTGDGAVEASPSKDRLLHGVRTANVQGTRAGVLHERSAGGLVLKRERNQYYGLVIGRATPRIWALPKGHIEQDESIEEAATREVLEETGIRGTIIVKLSDIRYWFYANKAKHSKIVHFFLMRYVEGTETPQEGEVDEVLWVPLDQVAGTLTHVNERRLIDIARAIISDKAPAALGFR